jgi:ribonuclease HII
MRQFDVIHPNYGLASHKGYATPEHRLALQEHGATPLHRQSFAPVRAANVKADDDAEPPFSLFEEDPGRWNDAFVAQEAR